VAGTFGSVEVRGYLAAGKSSNVGIGSHTEK